jgi:hypothetical protein
MIEHGPDGYLSPIIIFIVTFFGAIITYLLRGVLNVLVHL